MNNCISFNFIVCLLKAVVGGLDITLQDLGKKLVAMGTDGASVMTGRTNGVVQLVRQETSSEAMVGVHCFAHRLELAAKDVVKKHPIYADFEQLLKDLFRFYKMRYRGVICPDLRISSHHVF